MDPRGERGRGSRLGRYELLAAVASGGMASVWAARLRSQTLSKIVAVKAMLPSIADDPEYRTMFLDEARVASRLRHPNVCETFDLGEQDGELYMVMEWVDGVSLHRLVKSGGALPPRVAARIIAEACAGLHAAHEAMDDDGTPLAIVHRDVSPQNILLSSAGHVKVADFGIAKATGKSHATRAGQAKGKLAYMAPEQLDVRSSTVDSTAGATSIDRRVDVFALGCVLYEITTGRKPFDGPTDGAVLRAILETAPASPIELDASYPRALERIVARAMAKDRTARFASAEGLRLALEEFLADGAPVAEREIAAAVRTRCDEEIATRRARVREACGRAPAHVELPTPERAPPNETSRIVLIAGVLVVLLGVASAVRSWRDATPLPLSSSTSTLPHAAVTPALAASEPAEASPTEAATIAGPPVLSDDVSRDSPARPSVRFRLAVPHARLVVDGDPLEPGRDAVPRPPEGEMRVVLVKAPGHVDRIFIVDGTTPATVEVVLARAKTS